MGKKGVMMVAAGIFQFICMGILYASISTTRYKKGEMMGMYYHGQFMACPKDGPPGCGNMPDLVMLEVSKVFSAIQACLALGLTCYLIFFGLAVECKRAERYLPPDIHHLLFFGVLILSFIQMATGIAGPVMCTWCMEEAMPDLDFGYSMYLHWIQVPFSFLSFVLVLFTPMFSSKLEFGYGYELESLASIETKRT